MDPDPAAALARLLCVITPAQFEALVDQIIALSEVGYGRACIVWHRGKPNMVTLEASTKINDN